MFLETICIDHGNVCNLAGHIARMQQAAAHFRFRAPALPDLLLLLPAELHDTKVKCRIRYRETLLEISFDQYEPKRVQSLQMVEASPDYCFKYTNRDELNRLLEQKGEADEILITCNGLITDTTFSNVVFRQGDHLFTPDSWLLNGTKRQKLLREGTITVRKITRETVQAYESVHLINAMLDIEDTPPVPVSCIFP
ncbi:MAG: aminotransferase class IV [Proteiniphilum sp.]|jgi:4-amino-4-deoxychorismate lyase|nr:aminotransferase class IV [Proteiniphilum sp.]MDD2937603.1 aminotransferase class IV [Proteiniphilum sp.]MDD3074956.1 aminotransferase class IV [Proteiniphilum sp.]MDD3779304.1 aminotransferase class IV [Proteiniphilum sp.]MDD3955624.1 aminotransferase class IV [Proteiniphilum sp.]